MNIADTLYEAIGDILTYIEGGGMVPDGMMPHVEVTLFHMDYLRRKLDADGEEPPPYSEDARIIKVLGELDGKEQNSRRHTATHGDDDTAT